MSPAGSQSFWFLGRVLNSQTWCLCLITLYVCTYYDYFWLIYQWQNCVPSAQQHLYCTGAQNRVFKGLKLKWRITTVLSRHVITWGENIFCCMYADNSWLKGCTYCICIFIQYIKFADITFVILSSIFFQRIYFSCFWLQINVFFVVWEAFLSRMETYIQ